MMGKKDDGRERDAPAGSQQADGGRAGAARSKKAARLATTGINPEDFEIDFETRARRTHLDTHLVGITVYGFLEGPIGRIGEVARLTAWRYAPVLFQFAHFDLDLYGIFEAISLDGGHVGIGAVAEMIHKWQRALARAYDDAGWNGRPPPVGLVLLDLAWAQPALRGSGILLRLLRELQGVLCGGPHAIAGAIREIGHLVPEDEHGRAAREDAVAQRSPERLAKLLTSDPFLGLERRVRAEPTLVTGYWAGDVVRPVEEDIFQMTEAQIRSLLAKLD